MGLEEAAGVGREMKKAGLEELQKMEGEKGEEENGGEEEEGVTIVEEEESLGEVLDMEVLLLGWVRYLREIPFLLLFLPNHLKS